MKNRLKMKILLAVTGLILTGCVIFGEAYTPPDDGARQNPQPTAAQGYVIRDSGGVLAVFRKGEAQPVAVTGTRTATLPKSDAKKLAQGIEVSNRQELERVLEDFCS